MNKAILKLRVLQKNSGFTLIEMIIVIVILGILVSGLLSSYIIVLRGVSHVSQIMTAYEAAANCISWYAGQRKLNGYASLNPPGTTVPSFCTVPTGYSITTSITNTTISPDTVSNYKTIVVNVSYGGIPQASASLLIANY